MKLIHHMEFKVPMCGRSFESTFLASHNVDVIPTELCCIECIMEQWAVSVS
jgi:hypothetical protein